MVTIYSYHFVVTKPAKSRPPFPGVLSKLKGHGTAYHKLILIATYGSGCWCRWWWLVVVVVVVVVGGMSIFCRCTSSH